MEQYRFEGISQYRLPLCGELAGKSLRLVMDSGRTLNIEFLDADRLRFGEDGEETCEYRYNCLKVEDELYFVNWEQRVNTRRMGQTMALDLQSMLVTLVSACSQTDKRPGVFFTKTEVVFGAIQKADGTLEVKRHFYTTDLVGKAIRWDYTSDFAIIHTYPSERYYRPILIQNGNSVDREVLAILDEGRRMPWPNIGSSAIDWVKLREGCYLLNMIETSHPEMLLFPKKNCLTFVFDLKRVLNFGRAFGYIDSEAERENYLFTAYGRFVEMEPLTNDEVFNYDF